MAHFEFIEDCTRFLRSAGIDVSEYEMQHNTKGDIVSFKYSDDKGCIIWLVTTFLAIFGVEFHYSPNGYHSKTWLTFGAEAKGVWFIVIEEDYKTLTFQYH